MPVIFSIVRCLVLSLLQIKADNSRPDGRKPKRNFWGEGTGVPGVEKNRRWRSLDGDFQMKMKECETLCTRQRIESTEASCSMAEQSGGAGRKGQRYAGIKCQVSTADTGSAWTRWWPMTG